MLRNDKRRAARTADAQQLLPVVQALADELVDARLAADAADLGRRADGLARGCCPSAHWRLTRHSSFLPCSICWGKGLKGRAVTYGFLFTGHCHALPAGMDFCMYLSPCQAQVKCTSGVLAHLGVGGAGAAQAAGCGPMPGRHWGASWAAWQEGLHTRHQCLPPLPGQCNQYIQTIAMSRTASALLAATSNVKA